MCYTYFSTMINDRNRPIQPLFTSYNVTLTIDMILKTWNEWPE